MAQARQSEQWYTRRGGVVRGPFSAEEVSRYFLLGRICRNDEVSQDRQAWTVAYRCTELLPCELQNLSSWDDYQQLVIARMQVDERKGERRCQDCGRCGKCHSERRILPDRRGRDSDRLVSQYLFSQPAPSGSRLGSRGSIRPLLLTLLLVTMVFAWLLPLQR